MHKEEDMGQSKWMYPSWASRRHPLRGSTSCQYHCWGTSFFHMALGRWFTYQDQISIMQWAINKTKRCYQRIFMGWVAFILYKNSQELDSCGWNLFWLHADIIHEVYNSFVDAHFSGFQYSHKVVYQSSLFNSSKIYIMLTRKRKPVAVISELFNSLYSGNFHTESKTVTLSVSGYFCPE